MDSEAVIKHLVQLTQEGVIEWTRYQAHRDLTEGTDEIAHSYFITTYKGHRLRAYEARYRSYLDETRYVWETENRLEKVDADEVLLWRFPVSRWTGELLSAAAYQTTRVDDMFKDLMDEGQG